MEGMAKAQEPRNIALLPPPKLLGHLIPFIELAKKLVRDHSCNVTLMIPHDGSTPINPENSQLLLQSLPSQINPIFLPPVSIDDLPTHTNVEISLSICVIRSIPAIRNLLSSSQITALLVDILAPCAIDVAKELEIPAYIFCIKSANELSLSMDLPKYGQLDLPAVIKLPGSVILSPEDFPDPVKEWKSELHKWALDLSQKYMSADGILVNSFLELESEAFNDFEQRRRIEGIPPVYPVGPLIKTGTGNESDPDPDAGSECLKWLNKQPPKSVLFVSFGGVGSLSAEQFHELALGLEMSGQRFLWVVRLNGKSDINEDGYLPDGFLERTKERGLVVTKWVPQTRVLSHRSTGGFLMHCGWNWILESAVFGVPVIAWPLCSEHKMNAVFLSEGLKAAMRVGVVGRGEVAMMVKGLIEGEEGKGVRERMDDVKEAASKALSHDGSSALALAQLVQKWIAGN